MHSCVRKFVMSALLLVLAPLQTAHAALIDVTANGQISGLDLLGAPLDALNWSIAFTLDTAAVDTTPALPDRGIYYGAISAAQLTIDGTSLPTVAAPSGALNPVAFAYADRVFFGEYANGIGFYTGYFDATPLGLGYAVPFAFQLESFVSTAAATGAGTKALPTSAADLNALFAIKAPSFFLFDSDINLLGDDLEVSATAVDDGAAPVPEPATLALFGLGLAGLGWSRRKKA